MDDMTTGEITSLLRARYAPPAYAFLVQVGNGTGQYCKRHCDAIAMSLYPSRGLELHGFEVKVSRSDWKKELSQPEKAEAIAMYCHRWWIVAPKGIVPTADLPQKWGLLEATGGSLRCTKQADQLDATKPDWAFMAAVMRRVHEQSSDKQVLLTEYKRGWDEGRSHEKRLTESHDRTCQRRLDELKETVARFEKNSGLSIHTWDAARVGSAVRLLLEADKAVANIQWKLETAKEAAERISHIAKQVGELRLLSKSEELSTQ